MHDPELLKVTLTAEVACSVDQIDTVLALLPRQHNHRQSTLIDIDTRVPEYSSSLGYYRYYRYPGRIRLYLSNSVLCIVPYPGIGIDFFLSRDYQFTNLCTNFPRGGVGEQRVVSIINDSFGKLAPKI